MMAAGEVLNDDNNCGPTLFWLRFDLIVIVDLHGGNCDPTKYVVTDLHGSGCISPL